MSISAADVKKLRDTTGAGMMDCKRALVETKGDIDKAVEYLRKKGIASAQKRSDREAKEGVIISYTYSPEHYAVQAAAGHDYALFYEKEIAYRRMLNNPPFTQLASLVYSTE